MAQTKWRCTNFDNCDSAINREQFAVPKGAEFTCPTCGRRGGIQIKETRVGFFKYLVIGAAVLLFGIVIWLLLPPSHPPVIAQSATPAPPEIPLPPIPSATPVPVIQTPPPSPTQTQTPAASVVLRLNGPGTLADTLIPTLVEGFVKQENATKIQETVLAGSTEIQATFAPPSPTQIFDIAPESTDDAFSDLAEGNCDIALASRKVTTEEAGRLRDAGKGDMTSKVCEHIVALDALAIVVNPANGISQLTKVQLAQIFSGQRADWSTINGNGGPIDVCAESGSSDTTEAFRSLVLDGADVATTAKIFPNGAEVSNSVCSDPNAIGFVELPYIGNARRVPISSGGAVPLLPDQFDIATEDYALSRRLYLYTSANPQNPLTSRFVDFALSKNGQAVVEKTRFVAMRLGTGRSQIPYNAPSEYSGLVKDSDRLNLDFRFQTDSSQLDNKAAQDIDRVVDLLNSAPNKGRYIILVGFADSTGTPPYNLTLSKARAETVAEQLRQRGISPAVVTGFGQEVPVDTNDTEEGRERNRRVEIWLRQ